LQHKIQSHPSEKSHLKRKYYDSEHRNALRLQQAVDDGKAITSHTSQKEIQSLQQEVDKSNQREDQVSRQLTVMERERNLLVDKIQRSEQKTKQSDEDVLNQEQTEFRLKKTWPSPKMQRHISYLTKRLHSLEKLCEK